MSRADSPASTSPPTRLIPYTTLWLIALIVAIYLDRPVAQFLHDSGLAAKLKGTLLATLLKSPGNFSFTAALALLLLLLHPLRWRAAVLLLLAAAVSGLNFLVKWFAGRLRPFDDPILPGHLLPHTFHPFIHGLRGLVNARNLCLPSGHAALAFATAAMLASLLPRQRWLFYSLASLVAIERFAENAHYVSDCVAAALLGVLSAKLVWHFIRPFLAPSSVVPALAVLQNSPTSQS